MHPATASSRSIRSAGESFCRSFLFPATARSGRSSSHSWSVYLGRLSDRTRSLIVAAAPGTRPPHPACCRHTPNDRPHRQIRSPKILNHTEPWAAGGAWPAVRERHAGKQGRSQRRSHPWGALAPRRSATSTCGPVLAEATTPEPCALHAGAAAPSPARNATKGDKKLQMQSVNCSAPSRRKSADGSTPLRSAAPPPHHTSSPRRPFAKLRFKQTEEESGHARSASRRGVAGVVVPG